MTSETEINSQFDEIASSLMDFTRINWIDADVKRDVIRIISDKIYPDRPEGKTYPKPAIVEICSRMESIDDSIEKVTEPIAEAYYWALEYCR